MPDFQLPLAFVGGAILNLMPCVFPVISLKLLGAIGHGGDRNQLRKEGMAYAAGVVATFLTLGIGLAVLRSLGSQLGWGFQLQSPAIVVVLAVIFLLLGLNLSGVFEFSFRIPSWLNGVEMQGEKVAQSFMSGILAVVVASPCTAPFMGAALGYALTRSTWDTLLVFFLLGAGMAFPYTLLTLFPTWQRFLPKPGSWMVTLKQALAFPLYATVAWLLWVLDAMLSKEAVLLVSLGLVAAGLGVWSKGTYQSTGETAVAWRRLSMVANTTAAAICGVALLAL